MKSDVQKGTRFGSKKTDRLGADWKWTIGSHPTYEKVSKDSRLGPMIEAKLRNIAHAQQQALDATNFLLLLFFGGHAHTKVIESAGQLGIRASDSPSANMDRAQQASIKNAEKFGELPLDALG
jgi:hypothetical protein